MIKRDIRPDELARMGSIQRRELLEEGYSPEIQDEPLTLLEICFAILLAPFLIYDLLREYWDDYMYK